MIDSHCHLADPKFALDLPEVLQRAKAAGIDHFMAIADTLVEAKKCIELADSHSEIFCTVGIHPHGAKDWQEGDDDRLRSLVASSSKVKAMGEIGLDYHYDHSPRDIQRDVFGTQLLLAKELSLPSVVHCREAVEDVRAIIQEVDPVSLVIHCCTEEWEDVQELVAKGYFLSFTGIATYPNAIAVRRTIERCPLSQMMIETDSPYLAPVPHRGKRNEPAYVIEVARVIAQIKGLSLEEVQRATTEQTLAFFNLGAL